MQVVIVTPEQVAVVCVIQEAIVTPDQQHVICVVRVASIHYLVQRVVIFAMQVDLATLEQ